MKNDLILKEINKFVLKHLELDDIHGYYHTKRVYELCIKLGKSLKANLSILKIAALLHDIGRNYEVNDVKKRNHAEISAQVASQFLSSLNIKLTTTDIQSILHCIKVHSFSNTITPKSLEAKVLSDADKLDALGAIGLYRIIGHAIKNQGGIANVIQHLEEKILNLKNKLWLDDSKRIAEEREKIIIDFYNEIKNEIR
jgi:uncharacterized protein